MTKIETATATVADLEFKLADASARAVELQVERKRLAFDANTGNAKARKALDAANSASGAIGLEIENITSAIDEAKRRLANARRDEAAAAGRENALAVMALAAEAGERGRVVGQLFTELSRELRQTFEDARALSRLGVPAINQRSLILALTRTFLATFRDAGLDLDLIPPGQRHPPEELVRNNTDRAINWAEQFLAKEAA